MLMLDARPLSRGQIFSPIYCKISLIKIQSITQLPSLGHNFQFWPLQKLLIDRVYSYSTIIWGCYCPPGPAPAPVPPALYFKKLTDKETQFPPLYLEVFHTLISLPISFFLGLISKY